jgi:hypothetical protein
MITGGILDYCITNTDAKFVFMVLHERIPCYEKFSQLCYDKYQISRCLYMNYIDTIPKNYYSWVNGFVLHDWRLILDGQFIHIE